MAERGKLWLKWVRDWNRPPTSVQRLVPAGLWLGSSWWGLLRGACLFVGRGEREV